MLRSSSVWLTCVVLLASVTANAHVRPDDVVNNLLSNVVAFQVSYGSYPRASVEAIVIDSSCYVNIVDLAEYVGGSAKVQSNRVVFTLTGRTSHSLELTDNDLYLLDSGVYIRTATIDSLEGSTLSVDMLDLSIRIISARPLAIDLLRRKQLARLQRRATRMDPFEHSSEVVHSTPAFLGDGHLFYRFSTLWSRYGQSSLVSLSPQIQVVGGVLSVDYNSRFSDVGVSQQYVSGEWAYQRPDLSWLTELSVGTTAIRGLSRGNWLGVRARNTSLSWQPMYGYDNVSPDLDGGWDADVLLDGRVIAVAPSGESTVYRVPLHGGQTTIVVDAFDALGNNRAVEYRYRIHDESVPSGSLWYDVSAARSLSSPSLEAFTNIGYGVSTWLTLGGMSHARLDVQHWVPELYAHTRFARAQLVSLRYAPGQMGRVETSFLPYNDASIDVSYTRWLTDDVDTLMTRRPLFNGLRDELFANCFLPFSLSTLSNYVALTGWTRQGNDNDRVGGSIQVGTATSMLNLYARFRYDLSNGRTSQFVDLSSYIQLPIPVFAQSFVASWALRASSGMNVISRGVTSAAFELQASSMSFMDMQLLTAFRYDVITKQTFSSVRLQALLPFIRADASTSMSGPNRTSDMSLSGSVVMSGGGRDFDFHQYQRSRTGSINVIVYEDENQNGRLDVGEPLIDDPAVRCVGGDVRRLPDGRIVVIDLYPNSEYEVVIDPTSLPDPELILDRPSYTVLVTPHRRVELAIPLQRGASFEGSVISSRRVKVLLVNDNGEITSTTTFRDGSFTFGALRPGNYELQAVIDDKPVASRIVIDKQRRVQGSVVLRP